MKGMLLAAPLTILIDCIVFINFFSWQQQAVYEFQQRQLDIQVNYAVDAAAQEMLSDGTHIDTDYINWGSMTAEPEVALRTYEAVLLRNLGWADSESNREDLIESSVPFFMVASYDGYYMYCRQHDIVDATGDGSSSVEVDAYNFHWTPKIPYSETDGNMVYYYYLGADTYGSCKLDTTANALLTLKEDNQLNTGTGHGSYERSKSVIATTLTSAINSALFIGLEGNTDACYYIPASMSEWSSSNPIESPSVLTYVSRSDGSVMYDTVTFGIGGSKIDNADFVICYKVDEQRRYAWASDRDDIEGMGRTVLEVLTSPERAAEKGYYFDYDYYGVG